MTLWIIIGSLVGVVAIFLVVMSLKDRKKMKVEKEEKKRVEKIRNDSRFNLIVFLNVLIQENEKLLGKFVPSVGQLKMGDIRAKAKKALKDFRSTEEFKHAEESENNKKLIEVYNKFESANSNTWAKALNVEVKDLEKAQSELDTNFVKEYKSEVLKLIKESYK